MKVLFVADWGPDVGMGHFVRCEAIAVVLSGVTEGCYVPVQSLGRELLSCSPFVSSGPMTLQITSLIKRLEEPRLAA